MSKNSSLTVTDQFCGAGGSSIGAKKAGMEVRLGLNHNALSIDTYSTNNPETDVDCTDISAVDPRRYRSTDILITSPECTNHSLAKGKKREYYEKDLFGTVLMDPAEERSRATMWDVPRFAEYHDYNMIVVENVVDAGKWRLFEPWLGTMHALDYEHEVVYYNSMFSWPTPQSRDRMYTFFWKRGNKKPDLEFRPLARCLSCQVDVESIQTWKKKLQWGRYNKQYFYRCPSCNEKVDPYYYAAFNAIDFTIPSKRIGERKIALKPKTMARVKYGFETFGMHPMIITGRYTSGVACRVKDAYWDVMPTQPGDASHAVAMPYLVETAYTHSGDNRSISSLSAVTTQTTRQTMAVVGFIADMRGKSKAHELTDPLMCVTASDGHHALISTDSFLTYYYGTSKKASILSDPIGTISTNDHVGLVSGNSDNLTIDDLTYRMMRAHEIGKAMAFPSTYIVKGNQKQQTKQYGNAVTPPTMDQFLQRCAATFQ